MNEIKFRKTSLERALESIDLDDPDFPRKLREAEEEDKEWDEGDIEDLYAKLYFYKFRELRANGTDHLILRYFLRKTIYLGRKSLRNMNAISQIKKIVARVEDSYMEFEKGSRNIKLRKKCLDRALGLMKKYPDERVVEFIGRRSEAYLDLAQLEKNPKKRKEYLERAYSDSIMQVEKDSSIEALYKLAKICKFYSNLKIDNTNKKPKIDRGIEVIEKLRKGKPNFKTDSILGFFYLNRALFDENSNREEDYKKGLSLIRSSLEFINPGIIRGNTKVLYSYLGQGFSIAFNVGSKNLISTKEESLENLVLGITCQEISRDLENEDSFNYQAIGREYYNLQTLIEEIGNGKVPGMTSEKIKEKIQRVLDQKSKSNYSEEGTFSRYNGGLRKIIALEDKNPQLAKEIQFIILESALDAFKKSALARDDSPGNKSYQGMCIVDLAKLNNWLKRYSGAEIREKLEDAEKKLKTALEERVKEQPEDLYKDYKRLAECQFRLANLVNNDLNRKKSLYEHSIQNNKDAKDLLDGQKKPVNHEVYGSIASSHYKLAEISSEETIKKRHLGEAVRYWDQSAKTGDNYSENRSKKGNALLDLLNIESKEGFSRERIGKRIREIKQSLEEGVDRNRENQGYFVYPFVLLYYLAKDIEEGQILGVSVNNLSEFNLKTSQEYIKEALKIYTINKEWAVKRLSESANFVCESIDNHGLLEDTFILKHGNRRSLDVEMGVTEYLRNSLKDKLPDKGYLTPKPLDIIDHVDSDAKLSGSYYAMTRKHGITLDDFLKDEERSEEEKSEVLIKVVDYLAFIHANVPTDGKKVEDYYQKIKGKLEDLAKQGKIDTSTKDKILDNYSPIIDSFRGATLVLNKDAHPENWIVTPNGNIIAIDFGKDELVPAEFDLVNLMDYGEGISDKEKDKYLGSYNWAFEEHNSAQPNTNRLRYLNAVVHRAISLVAAWSVPQREAIQPKRPVILNKALQAIDKIQIEYNWYYNRYSPQYEEIKNGLNGIINSLAA
ncbi:MAG: hypothetical protein Q8N99_00770 [Nanoarchaeota archaeon]|nr:hypothetical protein [Nanoarchaeota archaeon]